MLSPLLSPTIHQRKKRYSEAGIVFSEAYLARVEALPDPGDGGAAATATVSVTVIHLAGHSECAGELFHGRLGWKEIGAESTATIGLKRALHARKEAVSSHGHPPELPLVFLPLNTHLNAQPLLRTVQQKVQISVPFLEH